MNVFGTVRFRLVLWNVAVLAVILAIFGYSLRFKIQSDLLAGVDQSLDRAQLSLAEDGLQVFLLRHGISAGLNFPALKTAANTNIQSLYPFSIVNLQGLPVYPEHPDLDASIVPESMHGHFVKSTVRIAGQPMRILSIPYILQGQLQCVVQFGRPLDPVYSEINRITRGLLTLIPLALLIVGAGALLLTERAMRPVRDIVIATEGIEASSLTGRLNERGTDEFSHLAKTINNMLGRLETAFRLLQDASEQQRRFTADASHELRTPLTIIKANTSLALSAERTPDEYRRTVDAVDRAADRMAKVVQDLLYIARSDAGQLFLAADTVNLRSTVLQAIESISDSKGHTIRQHVSSAIWTKGDEDALVRLFTNLLQNACNYTPKGGVISVSSNIKDGWAVVIVTDTGIGIAPEYIAHLGERFFRIDDGRTRDAGGSGLGLAICRSIVESHGGSLTLESQPGVGTTVTVKLPSIDHRPMNIAATDASYQKVKTAS
jgi:signal transduction histidine kinase